jgi:hypothetical protein
MKQTKLEGQTWACATSKANQLTKITTNERNLKIDASGQTDMNCISKDQCFKHNKHSVVSICYFLLTFDLGILDFSAPEPDIDDASARSTCK